MSVFAPIPLGQQIPASPHAVSCSLPTMRAVRGYEEKDPAIMEKLGAGYPRFVVHPFARELAAHVSAERALGGRRLWLTSSERMARELARHLGTGASAVEFKGVHGAAHPDTAEISSKAKLFLQNIGGFISSREAEDHLVRQGLKSDLYPEKLFPGNAAAEARSHLRRAFPGTADSDLLFANCGMNAAYAAFRAVSEIQAARGRSVWIQLGWLYLDTIAILKKFTQAGDYVYLPNVFDRAALERAFAQHGNRIAGLVTEIPTNPLIQTPDVAGLAELCSRHGAKLILDPSVGSAYSARVLPHADVVVCSLTKYTASEGDVIAGLAVANPERADSPEVLRRMAAHLEPVYPRDLERLAAQIGQTEEVLARIESNAPRVAEFLSKHPGVRDVFWALSPASREQYLKIAKGPSSVGGMISFTLRGSLDTFYDRLRLPKGPSFGMKTTLICPFMYLAHYDLVTTPAGRAELAASGLDPDLLRLCVGVEPAEEIIGALDEALAGA